MGTPPHVTAQARRLYADYKLSCKHDGTFQFVCDNARSTYYWVCEHSCGFFLNFDPDVFPNGLAYLDETPPGPRIYIDYKAGEL